MKVGILHPGAMGAALASNLDVERIWCSQDRSAETVSRATEVGLRDVGDLESLVASSEVIICVCPPAVAIEVARRVRDCAYRGLYVDVNAVSPQTSRHIGQLFDRYVDGAIIGPPPVKASSGTRLYLSGSEATAVADLFEGSFVDARVIGEAIGRASALKSAYASWTKASSALLLTVNAFAVAEGVDDLLAEEWAISLPDLAERLERISSSVGSKAWRFVGEMEEIAAAFGSAGLPAGSHLSAAEVYRRLDGLKDQPRARSPDEIASLLIDPTADRSVE